MRTTFTSLVIASVVLSGCSTWRDSRVNPSNWFGRASAEPVAASTEDVNPLIPRRGGLSASREAYRDSLNQTSPIATVTALRIERVPGGAIIRATGVDSRQGAFSVGLIPENEDELPVKGVLTYTMERQRPATPQAVGPVQTREVQVGRKLTNQQLSGVRRIRIVAAQNELSVRR